MQFASPIYLLGLLAIGIPILIHLIRNRKVTVVQWAAHRFLVSVVKRLQRRKRIQDILLLILRCLVLLLLALLFAQPFFSTSDTPAGNSETTVFLVDISASMGYSRGIGSSLSKAKELIKSSLGNLPASSRIGLVQYSDSPRPLVSPPTTDHSAVIRELERLNPQPKQSNLSPGLSAALQILEGTSSGKVIIVTDGQAAAWRDEQELSSLLNSASEDGIIIQILNTQGTEGLSNLGIRSLAINTTQAITNQPTGVEAVVFNGGTLPTERTRLVFTLDGEFSIDEAWVPPLGPGESTQIAIEVTIDKSGWHTLTAQLPGDNLAADDARTLGIHVSEQIRVGLLQGPRLSDKGIAPGFFLEAAAVPVPMSEQSQFPIEVVRINLADLTNLSPAKMRVLIVAGISNLSQTQLQALEDYVQKGGGLLILPPASVNAANIFIRNHPFGELLPASHLSVSNEEINLPAAPPYHHPVTQFWNSLSSGSLESFITDRHLIMEANEGALSLLNLMNGNPLFLSQSVGSGRILFSALPLEGSWSDMPLTPQFVPFIQRSLKWLAGETGSQLSVMPGEPWSLPVPAEHAGMPYYLKAPESDSAIMAGYVEYRNGQTVVTTQNTRIAGGYTVYLDPDGEPIGAFGVNLAADEMDLRPVSQDILDGLSGQGAIELDAAIQSSWLVSLSRALPNLWVLLAYVLLILGTVEFFYAQRLSRAQ